MILDLRALVEGANELTFEEPPEDLHIEDESLTFVGPIQSSVVVKKLGEALSATGASTFRIQLACGRCLESFEVGLSAEYAFVLQKGRPRVLAGDEDESLVWIDDEGDQIDLGKEVKDYIILEVPLKPLCDEACAGLCPTCGANLNQESCSCETETTDPRWEALRALKDER